MAVVGASRGIGRAIAERLSKKGAEVVLVARDEVALGEVARGLPGRSHVVAVDVTDPQAGMTMARAVETCCGRLDALVYSAGVLPLGPVSAMTLREFQHAMEVNFWGAVRSVQGLLPLLRRGERRSIVFLSSLATHFPLPFFAAYSGSKMALRGLAVALRQELASEGFHVGIVSPGPVDTGMVRGKLQTPLYRIPRWMPVLKAEDVAKAVDRVLLQRKADVVVPAWLTPLAWAGLARPFLMMRGYRWAVPGWEEEISHLVTNRTRFNQNRS